MLSPDQHLGPYRLVARVGAGGMGEVWRAEDTRLGRVVAIKVLPPSFIADAEAIARLKREARTAAQLYHPSIATIHSIEQDGDHIFIVEEFVEGDPLTRVIRRGGLSESEICRIGRAVADALAEAHAKGIVHRDIKPDNIIVNGNRIKVLDFGIAKQVGVVGASAEDTPTAAFVTQQGTILGTIHYMSPEQALGKAIDGRADVFSLGVVLYEMSTGRRPFGGETITETMTQIIRDEPTEPVLVNPGISTGMNEIIQRSLRKSPSERFTSAELVSALDAQIGRAPTTPYTSPNAVTDKTMAAEPTLLTGSKLETAKTAAQPKRSMALPVVITAVIAAIVAAVVVGMRHEAPPAATQTIAPKPVAPPATSSVEVTAPPTPTIVETTTTAAPAPTKETDTEDRSAARSEDADALYAAAMNEIRDRDPQQARKTLHRVLRQDPHYAKAHFRIGEIALISHNFNSAIDELNLALTDSDHLDERERELSRIALAVAERNRFETKRMSERFRERWPEDPDLARMAETFPGMFEGFTNFRGRRRLRP